MIEICVDFSKEDSLRRYGEGDFVRIGIQTKNNKKTRNPMPQWTLSLYNIVYYEDVFNFDIKTENYFL